MHGFRQPCLNVRMVWNVNTEAESTKKRQPSGGASVCLHWARVANSATVSQSKIFIRFEHLFVRKLIESVKHS